eukprot:UN27976
MWEELGSKSLEKIGSVFGFIDTDEKKKKDKLGPYTSKRNLLVKREPYFSEIPSARNHNHVKVFGDKFKSQVPEEMYTTNSTEQPILAVGVYNSKYQANSDWGPLTSPPWDMETMIEICGKFGLKLYCFINLTEKQMNDVTRLIQKTLKKNKQSSLLLHFSGHGGVLDNNVRLKLCFIGIDGKRNGQGCWSLLKFRNRTTIQDTFCVIIADCCREYIDYKEEPKGLDDNVVKSWGKFYVYT